MLKPQFNLSTNPLFNTNLCRRLSHWAQYQADIERCSTSDFFFRITGTPAGHIYRVTPTLHQPFQTEVEYASLLIPESEVCYPTYAPSADELFIFSYDDVANNTTVRAKYSEEHDDLLIYWGYEARAFYGINRDSASDDEYHSRYVCLFTKASNNDLTYDIDIDGIGITDIELLEVSTNAVKGERVDPVDVEPDYAALIAESKAEPNGSVATDKDTAQ